MKLIIEGVMAIGLVGNKLGMSRSFTEDGRSIPVTVVKIEDNFITQIKTVENDGYEAVQVSTGTKRHVNKPSAGHFAKAKVVPGAGLWEFRLQNGENLSEFVLGSTIELSRFEEGQYVDVTGTTKGKGFAGTIKRHHFTMGDATHGNSLSHRSPGSIGQRQSPGKVFKGKKMSGQMGNKQRTVQALEIIKVDEKRNLLLIKGAIPGAPGSRLIIKPTVKKVKSRGE
jgi:large subunit ribosomal protein L3